MADPPSLIQQHRTIGAARPQDATCARSPFFSSQLLRSAARFLASSISSILLVPSPASSTRRTRRLERDEPLADGLIRGSGRSHPTPLAARRVLRPKVGARDASRRHVNKTDQIARQVVRHVDCSHGRVRFKSNGKARGLERKVPDGAADDALGSGRKAVVRMAFYGIVIKVAVDEREVVRLDKVDLSLPWARHAVGDAGGCERQ